MQRLISSHTVMIQPEPIVSLTRYSLSINLFRHSSAFIYFQVSMCMYADAYPNSPWSLYRCELLYHSVYTCDDSSPTSNFSEPNASDRQGFPLKNSWICNLRTHRIQLRQLFNGLKKPLRIQSQSLHDKGVNQKTISYDFTTWRFTNRRLPARYFLVPSLHMLAFDTDLLSVFRLCTLRIPVHSTHVMYGSFCTPKSMQSMTEDCKFCSDPVH